VGISSVAKSAGLALIALVLLASLSVTGQPSEALNSEPLDTEPLDTERLKIDHVVPSVASEGDEITLLGEGFRNDSVVLWDTYELKSEFFTRSEIHFLVPTGINCGVHTLQIENPVLAIGSVVHPRETSQVREIFINCGPEGREGGPVIKMDRIEPSRVPSEGTLTLYGDGFVSPGTRVQFDNRVLNVRIESASKLTFDVPADASCGMHSIRVQSPGSGGAIIKANKTLWVEVLCGEFIRSPSITADVQLSDYDENGDCLIQNNEIFRALDDWILQRLFNDLFFEIVDAWVMGLDICATTRGFQTTELEFTNNNGHVIFRAQSPHITQLSIQIYDLHGQVLFTQSSNSSELSWNLRDLHQQPVANGVYLVSVMQNTLNGYATREVHKLALLR